MRLYKINLNVFKITIVVLFILFSFLSYSQTITSYTFSASSGTFSYLTGGTNPSLTSGSVDDGYFNNIPLGFTFVYMGRPITTVSASTNGWISMGNSITNSTLNNVIGNNGAPRPLIAPLWDDIDLQAATNLSYATTGTAGNKVFTLEYKNVQWDWNGTGNQISFQVMLFEATGVIQFIYQQEAGAVNNTSGGASIGITATATGNNNYLSLNGSGASPTANSTTETNNISTKPANGQIYTFTPPVLVPNSPTNITFTNIANTSYTINWTDASNEDVYNIYRSTDGINYTFIQQVAANTTTFNATGLTAATMYYWKIYSATEGYQSTPPLSGEHATLSAFTFTTDGSIIIPCGVTSVTVDAWGAGGGGGSSDNGTGRGGAGGGGGAFASGTHNVTSGSTYFYQVGNGGTGAPANSTNPATGGENSWFNAIAGTNSEPTTNVEGTMAEGGRRGQNNSNTGNNRGRAANSLGNINTTNGQNGSGAPTDGGGNGGNGANGGGTGGAGSTTTNGTNGNPPGGGGGGSDDDPSDKGGDGARGEIILYYPVYVPNTAPSGASASVSSGCNTPYTTTLTQTGGTLGTNAIWYWYSGSCGGTLVGTSREANAALTITVNASETYFVRAEGGNCSSTTSCASVSVTLNLLPTASAGGVISAFVGEYHTVSGASATNGTILWTHDGTGIFDETYFPVNNDETVTPTYLTSPDDFGQTVTLTMTVTGLGACSANTATANFTINVDGRPALWTYQCGTTLPSINDYVYAYTYPGATQYRFRINDGSNTYTFDTPASVFYFPQFGTQEYGTNYTCDVACFVSGSWTPFGPTCNITTPILPVTQIEPSQCGTTLASINTPIYAELVIGATQYRFRVFDGVTTTIIDNNSRLLLLTQLPTYTYGTTYTIDVSVDYGGFHPYGSTCTITTPSATVTQIEPSYCGNTLTDITDLIYAQEVVGASSYRFRVSNGLGTQTIDAPSRVFRLSNLSNVQYGVANTVDVDVFVNGSWLGYGPTCIINSPGSSVPVISAVHCGSTLTDITDLIYADEIMGASIYRFRVTNGLGTQTIDAPSRVFRLSNLSNIEYNAVNTVDVDVFVDGAWLGYGPTCLINSPIETPTNLAASHCNYTIISSDELIFADERPGATTYRFRLIEGANTLTVDKPLRIFRITDVPGVVVNTTYSVDIDVLINGIWTGYGATCNLTTPASFVYKHSNMDEFTMKDTLNNSQISSLNTNELENKTNLIAFPNPFKDNFELYFTSNTIENIEIEVFDATGKLIESHVSTTNKLNEIKFGNEFKSGIYFIHLKQDELIKYIKVIKY